MKPVFQGCSSFTLQPVAAPGRAPNHPDTQPGRHWESPELPPSSDALDFLGGKASAQGILAVLTGSPGPEAHRPPVPHLDRVQAGLELQPLPCAGTAGCITTPDLVFFLFGKLTNVGF